MRYKTAGPAVKLTPRQLQLLKMVAGYQQSRCYSPTLAEMASELNISRSTVYEHIDELRKKGLLSGSANKARSLKVGLRAQKLLSGLADDNPDWVAASSRFVSRASCPRFEGGTPSTPRDGQHSKGIPLAGRVAAGLPLEAVENTESLSLNSCFGNGDDIFALEVQGDSMIGEDIHEGDYVICRRKSVADDGQLVIAVVDNENATLKRFYKEKSRARLQPANDNFQPIYSYNCRIEAVVVGLIRKF